ncbi:ABC transporter ATP-binding protein [Pseudomonas sp. PDNC002]|uniref:ABC transporter ATP-binding protein n=1 Tax=Pseudomonas sp. PDNC002 TaxID=2811422 RepID=UPI0019650E65|nr:ABC transporter ATP-binding protein [Pseudomonas sp. PDNC002]QRY82411.1 ABC transporter ATP-binding protein [Pseudomonas sp. PDNC002]
MIVIKELTKRFGHHTVVDDLSFSIRQGEVLGFLGPNGAGKSTTMRMLTGFLAPTSGTASIHGYDILAQTRRAQKLIGYLPEGAPSYGDMSVTAYLDFIAGIRGFRGKQARERVGRVVEQLELEAVRRQTIDTLSKGFKRRVGVAQAILHDPQVLILDEPTDGLDPNQKHQVRELIKELAGGRITVVSTHILEEVSALCSRAVVIANGRLVADESPERLERRSRYHQAVSMIAECALDAVALAALPGVASVERSDAENGLTVLAKPGHVIFPQVSGLVHDRGWAVQQLTVERGRLDEVFRSLTRGRAA